MSYKKGSSSKQGSGASGGGSRGNASGPPGGTSSRLPFRGNPRGSENPGGPSNAGSDPVLIGNLRLFCDKRWGIEDIGYDGAQFSDVTMIPKGNPSFKLLSHCIHLGLRFLEHDLGNAALVATACDIIRQRREFKMSDRPARRAMGDNIYDMGNRHRPLSEMKYWVNEFLRKVRRDFPTTYATRTLPPFTDGMVHNCAWGTEMDKYEPKYGGRIYIHQCMVDQAIAIANAADDLKHKFDKYTKKGESSKAARAYKDLHAMYDNYDNAIYHLAVTFSHELCHLFTGFLTGLSRPRTPEGVTAADYSTPGYCGEHGWAWEYRLFRGCTFFFVDSEWEKEHPRQLQAGTPYAHDDDPTQQSWYKYKSDFPRKMIKLDFASCTAKSGNYFEAFDPQDPLTRAGVPATQVGKVREKMMQAGFARVGKVFPLTNPPRIIPAVERNVLLQLNTLPKFNVGRSEISIPLRPSALRVA